MLSSNEHDIQTDIRNLKAGILRVFSAFQHSGVAFIPLMGLMLGEHLLTVNIYEQDKFHAHCSWACKKVF